MRKSFSLRGPVCGAKLKTGHHGEEMRLECNMQHASGWRSVFSASGWPSCRWLGRCLLKRPTTARASIRGRRPELPELTASTWAGRAYSDWRGSRAYCPGTTGLITQGAMWPVVDPESYREPPQACTSSVPRRWLRMKSTWWRLTRHSGMQSGVSPA